jgi:hypothetical protein
VSAGGPTQDFLHLLDHSAASGSKIGQQDDLESKKKAWRAAWVFYTVVQCPMTGKQLPPLPHSPEIPMPPKPPADVPSSATMQEFNSPVISNFPVDPDYFSIINGYSAPDPVSPVDDPIDVTGKPTTSEFISDVIPDTPIDPAEYCFSIINGNPEWSRFSDGSIDFCLFKILGKHYRCPPKALF